MGKIQIKFYKWLWPLKKISYKKFGKRSLIYKPILISGKKYISVGDHVFIRNSARIECINKWNNELFYPNLVIGDHVTIEQNLHLTCAGEITIGDNTVITENVMITNIDHDYSTINQNILKNGIIVSPVKIGKNCFIGYGTQIFPGVHIGDNVIIGSGSLILNDIPDYSVVIGVPAKVIKKYNFDTKCWEKVKEMEENV